jgi:hypothetical protein
VKELELGLELDQQEQELELGQERTQRFCMI